MEKKGKKETKQKTVKKSIMHVGVVGSKNWTTPNRVQAAIAGLKPNINLITGDIGSGAGKFIVSYAKRLKLPFTVLEIPLETMVAHEAYDSFHDALLNQISLLLVFQKGHSPLQQKLINKAHTAEIPVITIKE